MHNREVIEALSVINKPVCLKLLNKERVKAHPQHILALVRNGGMWTIRRCKGKIRMVLEMPTENPFVPCWRNMQAGVLSMHAPTDADAWDTLPDSNPVVTAKPHWYDYMEAPRQPSPRY